MVQPASPLVANLLKSVLHGACSEERADEVVNFFTNEGVTTMPQLAALREVDLDSALARVSASLALRSAVRQAYAALVLPPANGTKSVSSSKSPNSTVVAEQPIPSASAPTARKVPNKDNLRSFLTSARPDWTEGDIVAVMAKLSRVKIENVITLVCALRNKGAWSDGINKRLETAGEKRFAEKTLQALCDQADELDRKLQAEREKLAAARAASTARKEVTERAATSMRGADRSSKDAELVAERALPAKVFKVVHRVVHVHKKPFWDSPRLGKKMHGRLVVAAEETFDGWVRLVREPGWMLKDMRGQRCEGVLLEPQGDTPILAVPEVVWDPGPQKLEVVFEPHVAVYAAPILTAEPVGLRRRGEEVHAEMQSYNGWVRLASNAGWMQSYSADGERLLSWKKMPLDKELGAAKAELYRMSDGHTYGAFGPVAAAKSAGLRAFVGQLEAKQQLQRSLRERIVGAGGDKRKLRVCAADAAAAEFPDEVALAERLLKEALVQQEQEAPKHEMLLEQLATAAASGDTLAVRTAREAAKNAGVSKKEIARVYALHAGTSA